MHAFNNYSQIMFQIIMPSTAYENSNMTKLFKIISDQYQNTNIAAVQRKYFNETKGTVELPPFTTVQHLVSHLYISGFFALISFYGQKGYPKKEDLYF